MNMDYCLSELKALLSIDSPSGFTDKAADYLIGELTALGYAPERTRKGGVFCCLGGEGSPLVLMAHVDTLGGMISTIKPNGRITITPIGGLRAENCEAENCRIYSRFSGVYSGTLQLCNASIHVNGSYGEKLRTFETTEVVLDEPVKSADDVRALGIEAGDFVCFDPRTVITESGYIKSRFLDDKLSAAMLLALAKEIKDNNRTLKRKVYLHFTVYEEVGHGASASVPNDAEELISVDMGCVGDGLTCTEREVFRRPVQLCRDNRACGSGEVRRCKVCRGRLSALRLRRRGIAAFRLGRASRPHRRRRLRFTRLRALPH